MMKSATLDVLDSSLYRDHSNFINGDQDLRFAFYKEGFLLDSNYWDKYYDNLKHLPFDWAEFKYDEIAQDKLKIDNIITKDQTGVYLFMVKSNNQIYDVHKYVLYVGIAGENAARRSLKERLNEYFYLEGIKKRNKVHMMLKKYYKNVYVAFSYLDVSPLELKEVEKNLHGFFYPIYCERDFPTDLKDKRKAFP